MERKLHQIIHMIACNPSGKSILLTKSDFASLSTALLSDMATLDVASFKTAVSMNLGIGSAKQDYPRWEQLFCDRFLKEIRENRFNPLYDFQGEEAIKYIEDYLESYRYSYLNINYATGDMHEGADEIINISLREKQNLFNKMLRRYGKTYGEINFLKSDVKRIQGSSLDFTVDVGSSTYRFGPDGVSQLR